MNEKFLIDDINEVRDDAYVALEKKCGDNFSEVLSDKAVDVLAVANIATTFTIDNETKQILTQVFTDTLNETEINKILTTDKQTLNNMLNAAKQLNEYVKDDNMRISYANDTELENAAYTKQQISELTNYIEQQTQQITRESAPEQKAVQKERKHNTIDF